MSAPPGFAQKVNGYSNVQLAEILASASDYTPEAVEIVTLEWEKRKLTPDAIVPELERLNERKRMQREPDPTKPMTVKGVGFVCYGRDYDQGVGYTTTQWFCLFLVPLLPVKSFHVDEVSFGAGGVASVVRLHVRQVVRTYLFIALVLAFELPGIWLVSKIYDAGYDYWGLAVTGLWVFLPILTLQLKRRNARRRR